MFKAWDERARTLTEGEPVYRQLHGLEAWFHSPHNPPPRWKMAAATFLGVFPLAMFLNLTLGSVIRSWNFVLSNALFNACVVAGLTWAVMPLLTRLLRGWLNPQPQTKGKIR
jgi:antibiotic biosynthesis monooxygenase (ABM) superfamily enzyme